MEGLQVAFLTLAALFVGLLIPVLLQARASLKQLEHQLAVNGDRVEPILSDAQSVVHRLNLISQGLEGREERVGEILDAAGDVAGSVQRFKGAARTATVVGGAVAAAVKAYREVSAGAEPEQVEPEIERAEAEAEGAAPGEPEVKAAAVEEVAVGVKGPPTQKKMSSIEEEAA